MKAYVSPTMGDVKERKAGFKEKVFMFVSKISPKGKSGLMKWETEHKKLSFMEELKYLRRWYWAANNNKPNQRQN
ncbi:hypothetical protein SLEP1_g54240 [Rubroshorea leprosula]|uniref:Uncharacterized protein n=1 Tax=Rubroshorea leprosula TaxID=152421 RepID=A0AAV5MBT0_9ROSI|nr:hypothetical protein SLEP1_g54240 [Rubroshorea leprosula]